MTEAESPEYDALRQGVRDGIVAALSRDVELRGARTLWRLVAAGIMGVIGAIGAMLLVIRHPFGHHPHGHELVFSAAWSGLLVVSLALVFLRIRTPRLAVGRASAVGLGALGLAGLCRFWCPDGHVMEWWLATGLASRLIDVGGVGLSALCFAWATTFVFAAVAAAIAFIGTPARHWRMYIVSAGMVVLLLLPGVLLESVDMGRLVLGTWLFGLVTGALAGVASVGSLRGCLAKP